MNSKTIGKIGVGSWTFPWATGTVLDHRPEHVLDPPGVVQRAKDLGVHVVHFLDNLPLDACEDGAIARVSELAAKHDIEVEIGTRGTDPEHLLRYLKIAEKMDARLIRTMGGWHGAPASLEEVSDNLSKVLPSFSDAGVRIAMQVHRPSVSQALLEPNYRRVDKKFTISDCYTTRDNFSPYSSI
jgi:hypothetical protein